MGTPLPFQIKDVDDKPCEFLFPWQSASPAAASSLVSNPNESQQQQQQQQEYTDADFARDMQRLSFQERQHITDDIHLVADRVKETDEFVQSKIQEMMTVLKGLTRKRFGRDAWDKAVFLRPSLAVDQRHYLMCLRFKAYDPYDAATALLKFYETKHQLWDGDDMCLCRRIMWDDLSEEDRVAHPRNGRQITYLTRNREESFLRVAYFRLCRTEPDLNCMAYLRGCMYDFLTYIFGNDEIQRHGQISVIDLRGPYKCTALQLLEINRILAPMMETFPCHSSVTHILLERNGIMTSLARRMQSMYHRKMRLRVRLHVGSWMEIHYSLRSFGIDIASDWLLEEGEDVQGNHPFSNAAVQAVSEEFRTMEQEWRQKEAPFCDPSSKFALYPNPQDIIMGKKKSIVLSWPGNLAYNMCIRQLAASYGTARNNLERQMVVKEVLQRMKQDHQARFLSRKENEGWDSLSDDEAVVKVSQSLRDEARKLTRKSS